jgi:hypothetical protein
MQALQPNIPLGEYLALFDETSYDMLEAGSMGCERLVSRRVQCVYV